MSYVQVLPRGFRMPKRHFLRIREAGTTYYIWRRSKYYERYIIRFRVRGLKIRVKAYAPDDSPDRGHLDTIQVNGFKWDSDHGKIWTLVTGKGAPENSLPVPVELTIRSHLEALKPRLDKLVQAEDGRRAIRRLQEAELVQRNISRHERHYQEVIQTLQ